MKTQEVATYLRSEAYWRQNCINESWNSVNRMCHATVCLKVTCRYFYKANFKPILFINIHIHIYIISTCHYVQVWYLIQLFKLPFKFYSPQIPFGIIDDKCDVQLLESCRTVVQMLLIYLYLLAELVVRVQCEFLWMYKTNCGVFLISFYAWHLIKPTEEQDIIEDKIKYYKFKQG